MDASVSMNMIRAALIVGFYLRSGFVVSVDSTVVMDMSVRVRFV
jgi:hypothetical protein